MKKQSKEELLDLVMTRHKKPEKPVLLNDGGKKQMTPAAKPGKPTITNLKGEPIYVVGKKSKTSIKSAKVIIAIFVLIISLVLCGTGLGVYFFKDITYDITSAQSNAFVLLDQNGNQIEELKGKRGEEIIFKVSVLPGYLSSELKVEYDGNVLEANSKGYYVFVYSGSTEIKVTGVYDTNYNVSFNVSSGLVVKQVGTNKHFTNGSTLTSNVGEFSFIVTNNVSSDLALSASDVTVTVNGEQVVAVNNVYVVMVTEQLIIKIVSNN